MDDYSRIGTWARDLGSPSSFLSMKVSIGRAVGSHSNDLGPLGTASGSRAGGFPVSAVGLGPPPGSHFQLCRVPPAQAPELEPPDRSSHLGWQGISATRQAALGLGEDGAFG
jgi:hypothetical protein